MSFLPIFKNLQISELRNRYIKKLDRRNVRCYIGYKRYLPKQWKSQYDHYRHFVVISETFFDLVITGASRPEHLEKKLEKKEKEKKEICKIVKLEKARLKTFCRFHSNCFRRLWPGSSIFIRLCAFLAYRLSVRKSWKEP